MGNTHMAEIARFEADMYVSKWQSPDDFKWGYGRDRGTSATLTILGVV